MGSVTFRALAFAVPSVGSADAAAAQKERIMAAGLRICMVSCFSFSYLSHSCLGGNVQFVKYSPGADDQCLYKLVVVGDERIEPTRQT